MTQENRQATERLIAFIQDSPTAFHAVNTAAGMLEEAGFTPPFVPGALKTLAGEVESLLEKIKV